MKARMKKLISIKSIPIFAIALLILLGTVWAVGREPATISGEVDLGTFTGTATVTIGGEELYGSVAVIPMADPEPRPDGGLYFPEVIHEFDFGDKGTLTTTGDEFVTPMGENVASLHGNMEITGGTGVFEGASGELRVNGQMDWSVGQATFEARGAISR